MMLNWPGRMLVWGIAAFLCGVLLMAGEMFARSSRYRKQQQSLERNCHDLAARLDALESYYPQALVMMDSRGLIRRVNGAAKRLFGYEEAELLGRSILQLLPTAPFALNPAAAPVSVADTREAAEEEVRCKDRSTVRVRMTATRSGSEEGSDTYIFFETANGEEQPSLELSQSRGAAASS